MHRLIAILALASSAYLTILPSLSVGTTCAYVASSSSGSLVVVNMDEMLLAGEIETGFGTTSIEAVPGNPTLFALDRFDQSVAVVDLERRTVTRTVDVSVGASHEFPVAEVLTVSTDGAFLAVATSNTGLSNLVTIWDLSTFVPVYSFGDVAQALALATNDGLRVFVSNLRASTTVFDIGLESFESLPVVATDLHLSSDGSFLLSAFEPLGPILLTSTEEGSSQVPIGEGLERVYDVCFSSDETKVLVAAGRLGVVVFSVGSQKEIISFDVGADIIRLARVPDSDLVAAATRSGEFFVINLVTGRTQPLDLETENIAKIAVAAVPRGCGVECVGDCDHDGQVVVSELVLGVALVLGTAGPMTCTALDRNEDNRYTIAELVEAVNNALAGCPVVTGLARSGQDQVFSKESEIE